MMIQSSESEDLFKKFTLTQVDTELLHIREVEIGFFSLRNNCVRFIWFVVGFNLDHETSKLDHKKDQAHQIKNWQTKELHVPNSQIESDESSI